jgi:hypothetical protein
MVSCKWDQTSVAVSVSDRHSGSKAKAAKATGKSKAAASSVEDIAAEPLALFGSRAGGGNGIEWADSGLLMFTGGPVRVPGLTTIRNPRGTCRHTRHADVSSVAHVPSAL